MPGIASAGLTAAVPFGGVDGSGTYRVVGRDLPATEAPPHGFQQTVSGDYFRTLDIPLVEGRFFNDADTGPPRRGLSWSMQLLARSGSFPARAPSGRQLQLRQPAQLHIVGVVGAINRRRSPPRLCSRSASTSTCSRCHSEPWVCSSRAGWPRRPARRRCCARRCKPSTPTRQSFEVRTLDAAALARVEAAPHAGIALRRFCPRSLCCSRPSVSTACSSSSVAERVREFGIRQALGADRAAILRLVLRQGLATACAGILAGAVGSLLLGRSLQSQLFGVTANDPLILAGGCVILLMVAVAAVYVPARRATMVDPLVALRDL